MREGIKLADARIVDLLKRVDHGESGQLWTELEAAWRAIQTATDAEGRRRALEDVGRLIKQGAADWQLWDQIFRTMEQKRRLQESEQKRLIAMGSMISAGEAINLAVALVSAVKAEVDDPATLRRINDRVFALVGRDGDV